jgi:hypothetical protein
VTQLQHLAPKEDSIIVGDLYSNLWKLKGQTWESIGGLSKKYADSHGALCSDGSLIVTGGLGGCEPKNDVYRYKWNTWTRLPSFKVARWSHASICFRSSLYIIGGRKSVSHEIDSVEKCVLPCGRWNDVSPLPSPCARVLVAVASGKLFVVGVEKRRVYVLSDDERNWSQKKDAPFEFSRWVCSAAVHSDQIYAVIGNNDFLRYNPSTDEWTILHRTSFDHTFGACVAFNQKIVVLGGNYGNEEIEEYDVDKDRWNTWQDLTLPTKYPLSFALAI